MSRIALAWLSLVMANCASMPDSLVRRQEVSARFEKCARSLSEHQCAIVFREACILEGLGENCYEDGR